MLMRLLFMLTVSFLVAQPSTLRADEPVEQPPRKRRILCNFDGCSTLFTRKGSKKPEAISANDLKAAIREVTEAGSQVDTVLLCVNAQAMYYPTEVGTMLGTLSTAEERAKWLPADRQWFDNLQTFVANDIDPWAIMLAEARKRGVEGLLSFRMNDAHQKAILDTTFWKDHPEFRLQGHALDFAHQEVRDHIFLLIQEAVGRYDCDGIELDFNRFPTYFKDGTTDERIEKINELVKRIRTMLDREGKKRNRRLVLGVRPPSSYTGSLTYEDSLAIGCDPVIWSKNGWIDFLTVSRFLSVTYDLPVAPWKKLVPEVPVYGCIEITDSESGGALTPKLYRRAARKIWDDGANGIYLFNFLITREGGREPSFEVLTELGNPTALLKDDEQDDAIAIEAPKSFARDSLPCERIAIGEPDDYKPCIAQLPDGELLLSCFHQYQREDNKVLEQTLLFRSKDGGQTWAGPEELDLLGREPYLTVLSDGTIFLTGHLLAQDVRNKWGYTTGFLHRSTDRGRTWQTIRVASENIKPNASNHTSRNILELSDGTLLVGADYDGGDGPYFVWRSNDRGKTWDKTQTCTPTDFKSVYGFFGGETWLWQARSGKVWAFVRVDSNEMPIAGRPFKAGDDQSDHFILFSSLNQGRTFERIQDFGDYGEMYMSLLRLSDKRMLLTFTVRDLKPPLGVRALLGKETNEGFEFDWKTDRLRLDAKTPVGKDQGGGFGPTVQLADDTLVTSYSYRGKDNKTHVEVVRWRLPPQ